MRARRSAVHEGRKLWEYVMIDNSERCIEILVGKKYHSYKKKWESFDHNKFLRAWSWPAFLLGPFWAAYRKMYIYAVLWTMASLCLSVVLELRNPADAALWLSTIIQMAIGGFYGAKLYQIHARKTVEAALTNASDYIELAKKGGTNLSAGILLAITTIALGASIGIALLYARGELPTVE
jgi:hypothetical protein